MTDPHSKELEQSILGSCLYGDDELTTAVTLIKESQFFHPGHRAIWKILCDLYQAGKKVDIVLVHEYIEDRYLKDLIPLTWGPGPNIEKRCQRLVELWMMREMRLIGVKLTSRAENEEDALELSGWAASSIAELTTDGGAATTRSMREIMEESYEAISTPKSSEGIVGIPTGLAKLDKLTSGWQEDQLIMLAARPSQGKSALAAKFAMTAARTGVPVGVFSLEMTDRAFAERILGAQSKVNIRDAYAGKAVDFVRLQKTYGELSGLEIQFDCSAQYMDQIIARIRRMKYLLGAKLFIIDYIGLIHSTARSTSDRADELGRYSRSLKLLAGELGVSIICLAQLNRDVEKRNPPRPIMSDLRSSGRLEEDADVVLMLWRPSTYGLESLTLHSGDVIGTDGLAEIMVTKNRTGPIGSLKATFIEEFTSFEEREMIHAA